MKTTAMEEKIHHWKQYFDYKYLGAYSLEPGEERVLTIKNLHQEEVVGNNGDKSMLPVLYFYDSPKPMILNKVNSKTITKIYKTPDPRQWIGKKIQIYVDPGVRVGRERVEALRIRPKEPEVAKPKLTKVMKEWAKVVEAIKAGKSLEVIEKYYDMTPELKKELLELTKTKTNDKS